MPRGRPATPPGTYGEINAKQRPSGKWVAETRLRHWDGRTSRISAHGRSKTAAITALKNKCALALGTNEAAELSATSTVEALVNHWLDSHTKLREQSRDRYRTSIRNHITPGFGQLRINEVTPAFLDTWLQGQSPGVAPNVRSVLRGAFKMAHRYGLMQTDPMQSVRELSTPAKEVRGLEREEIPRFRAAIAKSEDQTLIDVVDFSLATGLRAGEVLAVRWQDVDMEHTPPILHVTGTLVYSRKEGYRRQDKGKTASATRPIQLSALPVEILRRRYAEYGEHLEMVFPSGRGTYVWETNFNAKLRRWRGEEWEWVTIHTLRKTLSSLVAEELGPHKAAQVLGHKDSRLTEAVYVARSNRGVPIGSVVDEALPVS